MDLHYHILDIIRGTTVDGPGFRTSIYLSGCTHNCLGCHNPQSKDFDAGKIMTLTEILDIIKEEDFNVTLSGGDPLCSPDKTRILIENIKALGYNVWIYTGYTWEEILDSPTLLDSVKEADVIVDGPFVESLKDPDLLFKGSSNQRLIDIPNSLAKSKIVLYQKL